MGKKDLKNLQANNFKKKDIFVYGHPKFDLLSKENIKIFDDQVRKNKKKI